MININCIIAYKNKMLKIRALNDLFTLIIPCDVNKLESLVYSVSITLNNGSNGVKIGIRIR